MDDLASREYLALDDLGTPSSSVGETRASRELAYLLLDRRYRLGARFVTDITSNIPPERLANHFDPRVARRIDEMTSCYAMLHSERLSEISEQMDFRDDDRSSAQNS